MDAEAHTRVSPVSRMLLLFSACSLDIAINYPLWIYAKRVMAGLPRVRIREIYKGAGSLLLSCGPMTTLQDLTCFLILQRTGDGPTSTQAVSQTAHAMSACVSGAIGGLCVGAQIESIITRAHAMRESVWCTTKKTYSLGGFKALAFPYGGLMMAAREVPYAGTLFFLSGWIRERLTRNGIGEGVGRDILAALLSATIVGPISHVPSVIASHQQANNASISTACREMYATGGGTSFFRGILPRTLTLAGSLFVIPCAIEFLQPLIEVSGPPLLV